MNNNILRTPLITSAVLLAVISLLVYLTATSSDGSLWNSLGTLLVGTFRVVQLGLGLIVALLFCLAVLSAIFLGGVAMVSRESAAKMADSLRRQVNDRLLLVRSLVIRDVPPLGERVAGILASQWKAELLEKMEGTVAATREAQVHAVEKIERVERRLDRIEQHGAMDIRLEDHDAQMQGIAGQVQQVREQMALLQGKVDELISGSDDKQVDAVLTDLGRRMDSLEKSMIPLQEELTRARETWAGKEGSGKDPGREGETPPEHRLFTYLEDKNMRTKVEDLVTETLDKNMSYDQVIDHLLAHSGKDTADILAVHPSLVKDYIRYRRNNG